MENYGGTGIRLIHTLLRIHTQLAHDDLYVLALTETWIRVDDPEAVKLDLAPSGYTVHHVPRSTGRGGGLAFLHRTSVNISPLKTCPATTEFESQFAKLTSPSRSVDLISFYRPPGPVSSEFLDEFSGLLDIITTSDRGFLICGDFNCPSEDNKSIDSKLLYTLARYNMQQHVKFGTHEKGNLLDLILTSTVDALVSAVSVKPAGISNHLLVTCKLSVRLVNTTSVTYTYRNLKAIDIGSFCDAIHASGIYDDNVMSSAWATE